MRLRKWLKDYPGLKWNLGSLMLALVGCILLVSGLDGAGVVVAVAGCIGAKLWSSREELRYGWPPRLLTRSRDRDEEQ
jgi:hypothetical protein